MTGAEAYDEVLAGLLGVGPLKTWSLIVTILGDLASDEGARLPGPVLSQLVEPMGLKPEALRVAIHRLRRDGWILSEREGRTSLYGLTAHGREMTRNVASRVYGAARPEVREWTVVLTQSVEAMQALDMGELIQVGPRAALVPAGGADLPETVLAWPVVPGRLPDWAQDAVMPFEVCQSYAKLTQALERALALDRPADTLMRAVLRLAALHQWRRLVLRHGEGAEALMGPDWSGAEARRRIAEVLDRLPRPTPEGLQAALQG